MTFGFPWTVFMIINNSIISGGLSLNIVVSTLSGGLAAGFLFAWIMQYTAGRLVQKALVNTLPDEAIIKEGGANYLKGKDAVGGKLVLTDRRLIFKSNFIGNN